MAISQKWWDRWWDEDYSWDGLAKKDWDGWVVPEDGVPVPGKVGVDGDQATLQDYWRRAGLEEDIKREGHTCPKTGKQFTRIHLPLTFEDGSETLKGNDDKAFLEEVYDVLRSELARPIMETKYLDWGELEGPDHRMQWRGVVLPHFDLEDLSAQSRDEDDRIPLSLHAIDAAFLGDAWFNSAAFSGDVSFYSAAFSGDVSFYSAVFSGDTRFDSAVFSGDARFDSAAFSVDASFYSATFSGVAEFESAVFSGDAIFYGAAFSGDAGFSSAAFSGNARFDSASFSGDAGFYGAAFSGDAVFSSAAFSGKARFFSAAFSGDASFNSAAFSGVAEFDSAAFSGNANFDSATFSGHARFNSAAFSGYASFESVTFSGDAVFASAAFSGDAIFESAAFSGNTNFDSAVFSGYAIFESAAFSRGAIFEIATFSGDAWFDNAAFSEDACFASAAFSGEAHFNCAVFLGDADFGGEGRSLMSERRSIQRFVANGAMFLGPANFSNRNFLSGPEGVESDFDDAHFFHLFKLHDSSLHRGINFGKARVELALEQGKAQESCLPVPGALMEGLETLKRAVPEKPQPPKEDALESNKEQYVRDASKWSALYEGGLEEFQAWRRSEAQAFAEGSVEDRNEYFRALEDCYRTLKLFNEDRRDRVEEGRFHRLELIARRRRGRPKYTPLQMLAFWQEKEGIPIWERVLSHIYGGASRYGNSVVLPIVWLICGVLLFAAIYAAMASFPHHTPTVSELENALSFSAGRVLPFGPWADPEACSRIGQMLETAGRENCTGGAIHYGTWVPFGLRLLASFQSLTAIILAFLSGLAIRRRFQMN
ncbi:hypothetical protein HAD_08740 [Hyphomonas adhaerens MHS-3]|uniref:Pentapeptide repeat-containing protein n=1 Tax=Hyphomonas adhaerens MHS-3 TaxID=1280949 RepID=A0A069E729_9PROT|nr:pentapeptide repeat-containing protein [Hyphomonas adhaerens]KCZ85759.1 hypothetical protein HAD_08740 [Hyphomonas adhaerens MHS-3]